VVKSPKLHGETSTKTQFQACQVIDLTTTEKHQLAAAKASLDMQRELMRLSKKWEEFDFPQVR